MDYLWLLLIPYCTIVFGIHGGEFISGVNRQVRNVLCAAPFGLVCYFIFPFYSPLAFWLAFVGANMGFDKWPLWFKGLVTLPPFGAASLPLAYWIGYKTRWTNVLAEYLSGTFYGIILCALVEVLK